MFSSCLCSDDWKDARNVYIHIRRVIVSCRGKRKLINPYVCGGRLWVGKHQCSSIEISGSQSVWLLFPLSPKYLPEYSEEWSSRGLQKKWKCGLTLGRAVCSCILTSKRDLWCVNAISTNIPNDVEPLDNYFGETYVLGRPIVARGRGRPRRNHLLHPPRFPRLCRVSISLKPTTFQKPTTTWRLGTGGLKR